jgi:hypothetical protein
VWRGLVGLGVCVRDLLIISCNVNLMYAVGRVNKLYNNNFMGSSERKRNLEGVKKERRDIY